MLFIKTVAVLVLRKYPGGIENGIKFNLRIYVYALK